MTLVREPAETAPARRAWWRRRRAVVAAASVVFLALVVLVWRSCHAAGGEEGEANVVVSVQVAKAERG